MLFRSELSIAEAASIVGITQFPYKYDPSRGDWYRCLLYTSWTISCEPSAILMTTFARFVQESTQFSHTVEPVSYTHLLASCVLGTFEVFVDDGLPAPTVAVLLLHGAHHHDPVAPVSYTHLDVYKRQAAGWSGDRDRRCHPPAGSWQSPHRRRTAGPPGPGRPSRKMCIRDRARPTMRLYHRVVRLMWTTCFQKISPSTKMCIRDRSDGMTHKN